MSLTWRAAAVDTGAEVPTAPTWQAVDLPGRPASFAGEDAVAYRTAFADPRSGGEKHVLLRLSGLYAHARVWLNGRQVADHDAYFAPLCVPLPVEADNDLVVECRRPEDRFGGMHDTDRVPERARVPGVWWEARLETFPDPYLEYLRMTPRIEDGEGVLTVRTCVVGEGSTDRLTLSLRPDGSGRGGGMMERVPVEAAGGRTPVEYDVTVRDPARWWPTGYGDQSLYTLRATLGDAERVGRSGFRSVEFDADGLRVNGRPVPARGVNLVDGTPADVEAARRANANLVRAHAHVLSPAVYDACDEQGVLVWQDLPLTGPEPFDVERGRALAARLEAARANRPSLALVSVHDDAAPDRGKGLGSGLLSRLRYRWRAWRTDYDGGPARSVADAIDLVPTVPVVGPPAIDPDGVTLYPGWHFGDPADVDWLCDHFDVGGVVAEFGAGTGGEGAPLSGVAPGATAPEDGDVDRARQAAVVESVGRRLRLRGAPLIALYALNDHGGMGVLTADGAETPAFDRLREVYRPVQAVLADPAAGASDVVVVNDSPLEGEATVEWDVDGERDQTSVSLAGRDRAVVTTLDLSPGAEVTLAVAYGDSVVRTDYEV